MDSSMDQSTCSNMMDETCIYRPAGRRILPPTPHEIEILNTVRRLTSDMRSMRDELCHIRHAQSAHSQASGLHTVARSQEPAVRVQPTPRNNIANEAFLADAPVNFGRNRPFQHEDDLNEWLVPKTQRREACRQNLTETEGWVIPGSRAVEVGNENSTLNINMATPKLEPETHFRPQISRPQTTSQNTGCSEGSAFMRSISERKRRSKESICDLPKFNGEGSLKIFRQKFMDVCFMSGWDSEIEVVFWLKQSLSGRAADVLYDSCNSVDALWARLESRFGDHLLLQRYQTSLPTRKRQKDEKLLDLASDIRKMADIVYDGIDPYQKEKLVIQHFVNALNSPEVGYDISGKKPNTLEEALEIAMNRETYFGRESAWGSSRSNSGQNNNQLRQSAPQTVSAPIPNPWIMPPPQAPCPPMVNGWNGPMAFPPAPPPRNMAPPPQGYIPPPPQGYIPPPSQGYIPPPMMPGNQQPQRPINYNNGRRSCKHCGGDHPAYVCKPCRHCQGPHFDNQCPSRNGTAGNSRPIS